MKTISWLKTARRSMRVAAPLAHGLPARFTSETVSEIEEIDGEDGIGEVNTEKVRQKNQASVNTTHS